CSFTNVPAFTGIDELVLVPLLPSVISVAVTVALPPVSSVTLKAFVPATNAALDGNEALASDEVIATVSVTVFTRFQLASTALTRTLHGAPAVGVFGVPVLPGPLPGAAVSPGVRISSLANAPAPTLMTGLVLEIIPE